MKGYKINLKKLLKRFWFIVFIVLFFQTDSKCQEKKLYYDVIYRGSKIGQIIFIEKLKDNQRFYALEAEVKTRYIFSYQSYSIEKAVFEKGIMLYSFFYQKQNGKETTNEAIANGNYFKLISDGDIDSQYFIPIGFNTLQLYTNCPGKSVKVYATHYQKFLDFVKVSENKYRLTLPDGNYNYYHYKNGICDQVDIERTFFIIHFLLRKN